MKFKDISIMTRNKKTDQVSFHLRKKQLKILGITPDYLLRVTIPQKKVRFYKTQKEVHMNE